MAYQGVPRQAAPKTTHGRFKGAEKMFMGVELDLELIYRVDPREMLSKRNMNKHMRVVNKEVMLHWHKTYRERHFTKRGQAKHRYQRRTAATHKIKREKFGHILPIVQKGIARSMSENLRRVRATPKRGQLTMLGPWYMAHRQKKKAGGLSPDLKAELSNITMDEAKKLAEHGGRRLAHYLEQDKKRRLGAKREKAAKK